MCILGTSKMCILGTSPCCLNLSGKAFWQFLRYFVSQTIDIIYELDFLLNKNNNNIKIIFEYI